MDEAVPAPVSANAAPLIAPEELPRWVVEEDADFIVFNKPGWIVCHPSKNGPWSSLIGAAKEWKNAATLHLVSRLDRETSGVLLVAKNREAASKSQTAMERRWVSKTYWAILQGELAEPVLVDEPIGRAHGSPVVVKQTVSHAEDARAAVTFFEPLHTRRGHTLARVTPHTGRTHQIRVHAELLGLPIVGDKLYGPDERLYLEFVETGWGAHHDALLPLPRQALHAARLVFKSPQFARTFAAPLTEDLRAFCRDRLDLSAEEIAAVENAE